MQSLQVPMLHLLVVVLSALLSSAALAVTITLQDGTAPGTTAVNYNNTTDSYFDRLNPDTVNPSNTTTITVDADTTMWLRFGQFELILPPDAVVTAVTVELTVTASNGASAFNVHVVDPTKNVNTGGLTYNKWGTGATQFWELPGANGASDRSASVASVSPGAVVGGKVSFSLPTATMDSWIAAAGNNRGILIQNESANPGDFMTFATENNGTAANRPAITVEWTSNSYFWSQNTSNNWSNNNNWSEVDRYRIPKNAHPNAANHRAYFSHTHNAGNTNANCNIQSFGNISIYLLQTRNGYTGTWSNNNRSFTIGDGGFFIDSAMTYNHGTGSISVSGNMRVAFGANVTLSNPSTVVVGGSFTLQSNNTQFLINGNGGVTCGNYVQNNNSIMRIQGGGNITSTNGSISINNGTFEMQTGVVSSSTSVTITGNTAFSMQNGTITAPVGNGLTIAGTATVTKGNGTITADDLRISTSNGVSFSNETIIIADDVVISGTTGPPVVNFNNTTMTVGDAFQALNSATVNMNNCPVTVGNDITVSNTATFNMGGASISITDDLIINGSGIFNMSSGALTLGDDLNLSGTATFNMTNATFIITDDIQMSGGTFNAHPGSDLFVGEDFNMSGGLFVAPPAGRVMQVGTHFTQTGGVFQHNNGLVRMEVLGAPYNSPNANVNLASLQSLWDLEINRNLSSDDVNLTGTLNVDNDITISDGEFRMGGQTMYLGGNWIRNTIDTAFFPQTGTVVFDESQSITLDEPDAFFNVEIAKTGGHSVTLEVDHVIQNNFVITSGTYDVSADNWYVIVGGAITQTGGTFNQRTSWVVLNGGDQSPSLTNMTFYGLACVGSGTKAFTGNLTIQHRVTIRQGVTLSFAAGTCTVVDPLCFTDQAGSMSFQDGLHPTAGYSGTRDAWIDFNDQNDNEGTDTSIDIDGSPDQAGLVKWSLRPLPPGSTVTDASMSFTGFDATNDTYEIYRVVRQWVETEVTWLNATATNTWQTAGANHTTTDRNGTALGTLPTGTTGTFTVSLNAVILPFLQDWADVPETNTGFVILDYTVSDGIDLRSREYGTAAQRPRFNVDYSTIRGTVRVGVGGRVIVPDGTSIVQGTTATWEFVGTDASNTSTAASLESATPGVAKWSISIPASATFRAYGARFVDGNITVANNVTELTIGDAVFSNLPPATTNFLDLFAVTTGMVNLRRVGFTRGSAVAATLARNIRASATTVPVTVGGYSGDLGGEAFDDDPSNRIRWQNNHERYEVVHSTLGTSYVYSLPQALAILPAGGQTLTVRGQYINASQVITTFNQHTGRLVLPNFAGTLNLDGFKFISHDSASGIMLDLGAKTSGTVTVANSAFVDLGNAGVARAFVVPPAGAAVINLIFCTANSTSAASGVDGSSTSCIYTMSLTAPQRASRFVDHDAGDYHLTLNGLQNTSTATRNATYPRDLDGKTRPTGANNTFQGAFHGRTNAVSTVAVRDLQTGTTASSNTQVIFAGPPINNTAGGVVYMAGATSTTVRLSAMARSNLAVAAGNTVTWAGHLAGAVAFVQCTDVTTRYWCYVPYDSTGDGFFNAIRRVLHDSVANTLTDQGNVTTLNRSSAAIDFSSNGGWAGQLQLTNEFTGTPAGQFQVGLVTPASGGQVHTWFINANSADGGFYRTAAFANAGVAAESYIGGAGFNLNPRQDATIMLGGGPASGKIWVTRTADANTSVFIQFSRQDSATPVNNVTIDNSVAGAGAGSSFSTTPFQLFNVGGRRSAVRSDIPRYVVLSHQTMATSNLDVGGMAGFAGAEGVPPVGFFPTLQLFFGLFNSSTGRGAVVATEYAPHQNGGTTQELLDTSYTAFDSKFIYADNTGTSGSFAQAVAPVMGRPMRLAYAPAPASNAVVFCATDAGLLYCWEAGSTIPTTNTNRKGQLLDGFPIQFTGGRITAINFLNITDAGLLALLNLGASSNVCACFTDSGQVILVRTPEIP